MSLALKPRMSEKAYATSQALRTYIFEVPKSTNKHEIASAVAKQFEVTVTNVSLINVKGKVKRTFRKNSRPTVGKRSNVKKAYVTIAEGQNIPIFAAMEEAEAKSEKTAEAVKKAQDKADKKASKEKK